MNLLTLGFWKIAESGTTLNRQTFHEPSPILDFAWYPGATPKDPASFCFVASVRECPVKLLDASDGRVCWLILFSAQSINYFSFRSSELLIQLSITASDRLRPIRWLSTSRLTSQASSFSNIIISHDFLYKTLLWLRGCHWSLRHSPSRWRNPVGHNTLAEEQGRIERFSHLLCLHLPLFLIPTPTQVSYPQWHSPLRTIFTLQVVWYLRRRTSLCSESRRVKILSCLLAPD
jgi:hypothetical protein